MRHQAIRNLYPQVNVIQDGIGCFDDSGIPVELDEDAVEAETKKLLDAREALEYQRKRAIEYPTIVDQLDMLYHGGIDEWN
jgi:hypothetical protein